MSDETAARESPSLWLVLAMPASLAIVVLALVLGIAVGVLDEGGEASPTTTETVAPALETGAAVFTSASCGGCHTLSAAGSTGSVGPNLDETALTEPEIAAVVTQGRGTAMPAFGAQLSGDEIDAVAAYVRASADDAR
jgi:mono/diheme cytochrome c family protein